MVALNKFGKYDILRKLGRSMTDVYLARDSELDRPVVLKLIEHSRDEFTNLVIEAESRGASLQRELQQIDSRILQVYEFGERDGCFFVAMEYFRGRTLAAILQEEGRLEPKRAARYAADSCNQLRILHGFRSSAEGRATSVIHGDIKPSNIQIGALGELKLLDFGIAKIVTSTHNLTRHSLGSPSYCSPERLKEAQVDRYADLWALGVSLYEMLAGAPPYQAQDTRKLEDLIQSRRPPRALPDDCPRELRIIVAKALAGDVKRRYVSAEAFEEDLRAFLDHHPTQAECERGDCWNAKATVQRQQARSTKAVAEGSADARQLPQQTPRRGNHGTNMAIALLTGILAGLVLFIPFAYFWRLREAIAPLREPKNYARLSPQALASDWHTYQSMKHGHSWLRPVVPMDEAEGPLHANLMSSAADILGGFRHASDPQISNVDWPRARLYLLYALQIKPLDREAKGELYLCDGYLSFERNPNSPGVSRSLDYFHRAEILLRHSPDPHLGLARLYIYSLHNLGAAMAEFHRVQQLGYPWGPREIEQQADGYLFRAEWELNHAKRLPISNKQDIARWLERAHGDFDHAQSLYEPIAGFSKVDVNLQEVYQDQSERIRFQTEFSKPVFPKPHPNSWKSRYLKRTSWHRWR